MHTYSLFMHSLKVTDKNQMPPIYLIVIIYCLHFNFRLHALYNLSLIIFLSFVYVELTFFFFFFRMTIRELASEVHYCGRINRGLTCTYVGGDVDVHAETYDEDMLSFFEIEGIVKKYGYKSGDLVYYLEPGCNMQSGLKLISSDYDVLGMVAAHKGVLVIELYLVSFADHSVSNDEYEDNDEDEDNDGENTRIERDDPYWEEVFEPDLFDEDSYPPRSSMVGGNVGGNDEGAMMRGAMLRGPMMRAMLRGVMRVMGKVMRVRVGMRRVVSQWRVITKILLQRGLKERVEGVDVGAPTSI
jgi:hypothetical protein